MSPKRQITQRRVPPTDQIAPLRPAIGIPRLSDRHTPEAVIGMPRNQRSAYAGSSDQHGPEAAISMGRITQKRRFFLLFSLFLADKYARLWEVI
jgi:hypothetical protein